MIESITSFLLEYKIIILFYLVLAMIVYHFRKKMEVQAKVIMLFRTQFGIKAMKLASKKYGEWIKLLGYTGVGVGFIGMILITYTLIHNLIKLLIQPAATSGVALVLPGVNVPGLGILPFWHWLLAIFVIALIHEFGHGIVAKAHGIKVHNSGFVLIGPIIGAFVEPDIKQMEKSKDIVNYSILAGGPFANILLAGVALLLLNLVLSPVQGLMLEDTGFTFDSYSGEGMPTELAGIPEKAIINSINNEATTTFQDFATVLQCSDPGENITVTTIEEDGTQNSFVITLGNNPDNPEKPFLGISTISNEFDLKPEFETGFNRAVYEVTSWFTDFARWLFVLSLGIGLFNLLPLPIVDGGKMSQIFLRKLKGKNSGDLHYHKISMFMLFVLVFSLLLPLIKNIFSALF